MPSEVKVTRKYQVTIPEEVRSTVGIKVGDKLLVRAEKGKVVFEVPERVPDPVEFLWNLSKEPLKVDAVKLVEGSWGRTVPKKVRRAATSTGRAGRPRVRI